jgi:hypothetical protein
MALLEPNIPPDKRRWSDHDQFINTSTLCNACTRLMPDDAGGLYYCAYGDDQEFIPNPRYQAGLVAQNIIE